MVETSESEPGLVQTEPFLVVEKPVDWTLDTDCAHSVIDWLVSRGLEPTSPLIQLDDDESGLVVFVAQDGLEARVSFEALVTPGLNASGHIAKPIARSSQTVNAVTRYELLRDFGICSWARFEPDAPRLNQVREHLQRIGLSVIGDRRFQGPKFVKVPRFPGRLWLHLTRVAVGGMTYESSLPTRLAEHLEHLSGESSQA